jgi:CxxC-x17-CxxC domain-containing protein
MGFADQDVLCEDCGVMFVFSAGEQQFFKEKGFLNLPKHCKLCKAKRQGGVGRRIETHVICSECGSQTSVAFKPTQGRPVLCRTCFGNKPKGIHRMSETMGSVINKVVHAAERMGLLVTDEQAREAIARQNDDYVIDAFNPMTPMPELPSETIDRYAESLLDMK